MADLETTVYDSVEGVNRNQWNNLVEQSDLGCVFHRYEWLRAVEDGIDARGAHVVVAKDGNPVAVLPNFVTDLDVPSAEAVAEHLPTDRLPDAVGERVDDYADGFDPLRNGHGPPLEQLTSTSPGFGGPVIGGDERACLDRLIGALDERAERPVVAHAIKAKETGYVRYGKSLAKRGYSPTLLDCRFELDIRGDFEDVVARMDGSRRKALRDARESTSAVSELALSDGLANTYDRYATDVERVGGDALPRTFFEALADHMSDRVRVFSAAVDGTEVGRYVHVLDDEQSAVHYYFSAIGDAENFEHNPTELLHAHAIQWAQERGYRTYDFGSTGSTFSDGAFRYKEQYGGRVVPTLRWEKGYAPVLWNAYKLGRRGYQRLAYGGQ